MSTAPSHHAPLSALSPLGLLTILLTLLGWSSVPLFLRDFAREIDAWTANGWRYGFSAILWIPAIIYFHQRRTLPAGIWRAAVVPTIFNVVGQACFAWVPYFIKPGLMTFGLRTQILFVAIGAYLLFPSERRVLQSRIFLFALLSVFVGAVGTMLLAPPDLSASADVRTPTILGHTLSHSQATYFGGTLAVLSGALFAGYALSIRRYMHGVNPVAAFSVICQYTGIAMIALMLLFAPDAGMRLLDLTPDRLGLVALSAIVGIALGHVFYYISIARLGVALSSGIVQLQPILVAVASTYLLESRFQEHLTESQWLCGFAAVAGATLMLVVQKRITSRSAI